MHHPALFAVVVLKLFTDAMLIYWMILRRRNAAAAAARDQSQGGEGP